MQSSSQLGPLKNYLGGKRFTDEEEDEMDVQK
jgi:hypothetical protein